MKRNETATLLLDAAQALIQERGYNAFSYKGLAASIGIRTASIHYHFPAKGDLGVALMERYLEALEAELSRLDRSSKTVPSKLKSFIKLYNETESRGAICLCGSLASDRETLPEPLQDVVSRYLDVSEQWVARQISEGVSEGLFGYRGRASEAATALISSLQGGLILSRASSDGTPRVASVQRVFFKTLEAE